MVNYHNWVGSRDGQLNVIKSGRGRGGRPPGQRKRVIFIIKRSNFLVNTPLRKRRPSSSPSPSPLYFRFSMWSGLPVVQIQTQTRNQYFFFPNCCYLHRGLTFVLNSLFFAFSSLKFICVSKFNLFSLTQQYINIK